MIDMLFFALILYLILWYPLNIYLFPLIPWLPHSPVALMVILFTACFAVAYLAVTLFDAYHPPANEPLKKLLRLKGMKSISLFIALSSLCIIYISPLVVHPSVIFMVIPTFLVMILNAFGFDILPETLQMKPQHLLQLPEYKPEKIPAPRAMPQDGGGGDFSKEFCWTDAGEKHCINLQIRQSEYERAVSKPRAKYPQWAEEYVANGITSEVRELAYRLSKMCTSKKIKDEVMFVLGFVQSAIRYELDEVHHQYEYPKYPIETLVDGTGDCEDVAILGAALLKSMGYEVALLISRTHAALGVAGTEAISGTYIPYEIQRGDEKEIIKYFYYEMTTNGWQLGDVPTNVEASIEVFPVPNIVVSENSEE